MKVFRGFRRNPATPGTPISDAVSRSITIGRFRKLAGSFHFVCEKTRNRWDEVDFPSSDWPEPVTRERLEIDSPCDRVR